MPATLTPQAFVAKWRQATLNERSAAQEHFLDLCRLLGHPTPAEVDPTGTFFTFEAGAAKQGGGQGFADVWTNAASSPGSTRASTPTWTRPTSSCSSTARRSRTRRCWSSATSTASSSTPTSPTRSSARPRSRLDDLLTPDGLATLRRPFSPTRIISEPRRRRSRSPSRPRGEFARLADRLRKYGQPPAGRPLPDPPALLPLRRGRRAAAAGPVHPAGRAHPPASPAAFATQLAPAVRGHGSGRLVRRRSRSPTSTAACSTTTRCWSWTATAWTSWPASRPLDWSAHRAVHLRHAVRAQPRPGQALAARRALHQQRGHPADRRAGADGAAAPARGPRCRRRRRSWPRGATRPDGRQRTNLAQASWPSC